MKHIVIPARYQSSRLPAKPLLLIHGRPMVLRVVDQAKKVEGFDDLCVATDHPQIFGGGYSLASTRSAGTKCIAYPVS